MKAHGVFTVSLQDGDSDQLMPNGGWSVKSIYGPTLCQSIDWSEDDWQDQSTVALNERLNRAGIIMAKVSGESATGKTGFRGHILKRAGSSLLIMGDAWFASHAARLDQNAGVCVNTYTFSIRMVDCQYSGSLEQFTGLPVQRVLLELQLLSWQNALEKAQQNDRYFMSPEFCLGQIESIQGLLEEFTFQPSKVGLVNIPL